MQPGAMIGPHMSLTRAERERFTLPNLIDACLNDNSAELAAFRKLSDGVGLITGQRTASLGAFLFAGDQLGWLNHELNVENASGLRKVATVSQELSTSSARLEEVLRQLSESLTGQLKELTQRLDSIQSKVSSLK